METFPVTGVILAGGDSSRMGSDKAFLRLGSRTIIEELILRLGKHFSELIIVANDLKKYTRLITSVSCSAVHEPLTGTATAITVLRDIIPDKGPLGGIYTALIAAATNYSFVFACDAPFVNGGLINYMIRRANGADIIVPRWKGRFEPLHAIYAKKCADIIKAQLKKDDLKITRFFNDMSLSIVEHELKRFMATPAPFLNLNTKKEYHDAEICYAQKKTAFGKQ